MSTLLDLLLSLIPVFTRPSADLFRALVVGWALCGTRRTVTALLPFADPDLAHAHDAFHPFFRAGAWTVTRLCRLWAILLINALAPTEPERLLATDDTIHKKTGRTVAGATWRRDAVRSTGRRPLHVWGLHVVVLTRRVKPPWGGIAFQHLGPTGHTWRNSPPPSWRPWHAPSDVRKSTVVNLG